MADKEEIQEVEQDDLRADLEAAIKEVEDSLDEPKAESSASTDDDKSPVSTADGGETGAKGEGGGRTDEPTGDTDTAGMAGKPKDDSPKPEDAGSEGGETGTVQGDSASVAPQTWTPAAREKWKDIPADVQQEINKREDEIVKAFQATGEARRIADQFQQLTTPYQPLIAAEGAQDAFQAVDGLLKTAATLAMGTQEQKAQRMAQLISHYKIDIATLDNVLAGEPAVDPQRQQFEQILDERMQPVNQLLERINQSAQTASQQREQTVEAELQQFSQNAEFLEDVRFVMADMLDAAANNNQPLSMQEAYDIACQMNPQIKQVLEQRNAQQQQLEAQAALEAKKEASSSIVGAPSGGNSSEAPGAGTLRGDIEAAWDGVASGR